MNRALIWAAAAVLSGCAAKKIPGTQLDDTRQTRDILRLFETYQVAVENKDVEGVLKLLSNDFRDDAGTPALDDDLTRSNIAAALAKRFGSLGSVKLQVDVREILPGDAETRAVYTYSLLAETLEKPPRNLSLNDIKTMRLKKTSSGWTIVSGI